jgi:hypothetical protein
MGRIAPNPVRLAVSVLIMLTVLVPAAYLGLPHFYRWRVLNRLTAADAAARQQALAYVAARADQNPRVREGAIDRLRDLDRGERFADIVAALDRAGAWSRQTAGDRLWFRWLRLLSQRDAAEAREMALRRLTAMPALAGERRMKRTAHRLAEADSADVRRAALELAAQFAPLTDTPVYRRIVHNRRTDETASVARQAWILIGFLASQEPVTVKRDETRPAVAEAMVWAVGRRQAAGAVESLSGIYHNRDRSGRVRAMALYAIARHGGEAATERLLQEALKQVDGQLQLRPTHPVLRHRIVRLSDHFPPLTLGLKKATGNPQLVERLRRWIEPLSNEPPLSTLMAAAVYTHATAFPHPDGLANEPWPPAIQLAALEGVAGHPISASMAAEGDLPIARRLVVARAMANPPPSLLMPALDHERATVRDQACLIASRRLPENRQRELIRHLLTDYSDDAKRAGAILAGLTGLKLSLLDERAAAEAVWSVRQVMDLGRWMQGQIGDLEQRLPALLGRDEVARSTVLLAMLRRRPPRALDYLFHEPGYTDEALLKLLDHHRWWEVLRHWLPAEAPPYWYWSDARLQRFQVEALKQWHLTRRHAS